MKNLFLGAVLSINALPLAKSFAPAPVRPFGSISRGTSHGCDSSRSTTLTRPSSSARFGLFDDVEDFIGENAPKVWIPLLLAAFLATSFQVVDTGEIGILNQFGSLSQLDPGLHIVPPIISKMVFLSTKTTLLEQSNFVPTKEGLTVELDTAILFRLSPDDGLALYGSVGKEYVDKLLTPEASSAVRGLTSESEAKALYTSGRSDIQNRLKEELTSSLAPRGIVIEDVLLKAVQLPDDLSKSIEEKARAEQDSARMEFVLQKEHQEAERKAIEAQGIAEFQRIVSKGITPSLLQWKGIEATELFAKSDNSKVVIMGNSKDSLPVILGGDK